MTKSLCSSRWLLAAAAALGLGSVGSASDVKIENYSNGPVYVAQANNRGALVSHGWVLIEPNESQIFFAPDSSDLFIRVQDKNGKEITFTNHSTFLNFPANADQFYVSTAPDDPSIWMLKHGDALEFSKNIKKGDELPDGWHNRAFFQIGIGSHKLEIKP